ncbi:hypothetical protein WI61_07365 [Burkholderia cepacia]|nr:hypothetical protein WI48_01830 [Burkholderia cepacia]KVA70819.1 hypothetical protein WI49_35575 [Burkholderia cepacia]KVA77520.1 hypothetical protein WI52_27160 [Burkholderia cepacia]KVA82354.1 hypothetical protein WI51_24935 [Burkholderia cepacia]KVA84243.1 hypothetical protein WI50_18855 [Burkholderia cepacia]
MTWMANNLQSSTHDLPTRMPEVDHPQNLPMSWLQRSPRPGYTFGIAGIVRAAIRLPPIAKTLIE